MKDNMIKSIIICDDNRKKTIEKVTRNEICQEWNHKINNVRYWQDN